MSLRTPIAAGEAGAENETNDLRITPSGEARRLAATLAASAPPKSLIAITGVDATDDVGSVTFQSGLALSHLHAGEILLVKPGLLHGIRMQNTEDDARSNRVELRDLPGLFEVINYPRLLVLYAWRYPTYAEQHSLSLLTVLRDVSKHFRLTIVECPPLLQSAETALLASYCEGVVVVLNNARHTRTELREVQTELQRLNARFLGAVLSRRETRRRGLFRRG